MSGVTDLLFDFPLIRRLLQDYSIRVVPDRLRLRISGHAANVKCVDFVGDQGHIVSGSR